MSKTYLLNLTGKPFFLREVVWKDKDLLNSCKGDLLAL